MPRPGFGSGEITRAGQVLRSEASTEEQLQEAAEVLSRWRAIHLYPLNTFQATLRKRMSRLTIPVVVGQRLKRATSVVAKLRDRPTMRLQQMQDIVGLRGIVPNMGQLGLLAGLYLRGQLVHERVAQDNYIVTPKADGYRSLHIVYKYRSQAPQYDGLHVELQIRTKLQHAWATAVETVDVFTGQQIKAGRAATPEWARFFSATSAAFAQLEACQPVPGYEGMSPRAIVPALRDSERAMNVLTRLRGFRAAINAIMGREQNRSSFLHLVVLDTLSRTLSFRSFSREQQAEATNAYKEVEERMRNGAPLDPVLVVGGTLRQLKTSYPNYFADTQEFVEKVESVLSAG